MHELSDRSVGPSSRYTVLASNVAKVTRHLERRSIMEQEQVLMRRAAELVGNIIQGSLFVERRETQGLSNAHESLFAVDHAISALKLIKLDSEKSKQLTRVFQQYETDLLALSEGNTIPVNRLQEIRTFFDVLSDLFYQDVADSTLTAPHAETTPQEP